jgi:5-methyltetrahydropteroyltriglutamate--homocysteine methyltransferase
VKRSDRRILTTHVGSLPRPDDLMALYAANAPDETLQPRLRAAVGDIVRRQAESGIDVINDGEYGKAMRSAMDFGAWWSYVYPRLEGFELREEHAKKGRAAWTFGSKERKEFAEFYAAEASAAASAARQSGSSSAQLYGLTCAGPVKYVGHAAIKRDIDNMAAAARANGRGGVHDGGVARDAADSSQCLLQKCRGLHHRIGRGDPRGIQGHRRCRLHPSDRRPGAGRHL